jgi:hypothetical protein
MRKWLVLAARCPLDFSPTYFQHVLNCKFHVYVLVKFHDFFTVVLLPPIWLLDF